VPTSAQTKNQCDTRCTRKITSNPTPIASLKVPFSSATTPRTIKYGWRILVSLLSLAIICLGVGYAVGRERLRDPDHLHALYQETNKQFFGGQLCDVEVKSHDLSDADAAGVTNQEMADRFVIVTKSYPVTSNF
jgi:hypothetical protein